MASAKRRKTYTSKEVAELIMQDSDSDMSEFSGFSSPDDIDSQDESDSDGNCEGE